MTDFNPVKAARAIDTAYRRYLATTFTPRRAWFAENYQQALEAAIDTGELGGRLHLQPRREYVQGCTLTELADEGVLTRRMEGVLDFPLYQHQEKAIRSAVDGLENLVIATGTGSGKTETFLLPILNSLLREAETGPLTAGVRAVLLYPMNALASDQMKRLRELLEQFPGITYGRFVGPTKETDLEAARDWQGHHGSDPVPAGEMLSRKAMRESPPHILVTNYAMLERLLLLPSNDSLFSPTLRTIVMDEVHVYNGAKGTEIAMLLRRLRSRCVSSSLAVQCFAASATLGNGSPTDNERAAKFAEDLFGAPFNDSGVVTPVYREAAAPRGTEGPAMERLYAAINRNEIIDASEPQWDSVVAELARNPGQHAVRFHQVVRSPGGAFCCLHPRHPSGAARMRLQLARDCQPCAEAGVTARLLELGACRQCGWEYVVGRTSPQGALLPVDEVGDGAKYFRIMKLSIPGVLDEDLPGVEDDDDAAAPDQTETPRWVCLECGTLKNEGSCTGVQCTSQALLAVRELSPRPNEESVRCGHCQNAGSGFGPVSRPSAGPDALSSVIATAIYQHLPAPAGPYLEKPGEGRKLLVFSDSRQDAAYFAPYLGDTYGRMLRRSLVVSSLRSLRAATQYKSPFGLDLVADELAAKIEGAHIARGNAAAQLARVWLRAEAMALATDPRQSLEGVGMVRWELPPGEATHALAVLTNCGLARPRAWAVLHLLLDTMRADAAVWCPTGVAPSNPLFAPRNTVHAFYQEGQPPNSAMHPWLPASIRGNRRSKIVSAALGAGPEDQQRVHQVLQGVWAALIHKDHIVKPVREGALALAWESLHLALTEDETSAWWCSACRRWSWWAANDACATPGCHGAPSEQPRSRDHYAEQYGSLRPLPLIAREHTAQWTAEQAEQVQQEFMDGDVTVLSCSTTFEMGVDLGDVSVVLCRNVPPTPANYVQRAGRAGRRSGDPSLVVTLARRRSHDAQYAKEPARLISGTVPVPQLSLTNPDLLRRHLYAIALGAYLRAHPDTSIQAGEFFAEGGPADAFALWVADPTNVDAGVKALDLMADSLDCLGLPGDDWVTRLSKPNKVDGVGGWLSKARDVIQDDMAVVAERRSDILQRLNRDEKLPSGKDYAGVYSLLGRVSKELAQRDVIGILANQGVLPKYGFPVDVVSLQPRFDDVATCSGVQKLDLTRDLRVALAEYFPGSEVVADGTFLRSIGLRKSPQGTFDALRWRFVTCERCGWYKHARQPDTMHDAQLPTECARCEAPLEGRPSSFVQPVHGFVAEIVNDRVGSSRRPRRRGRTRTYLSSTEQNDGELWQSHMPGLDTLLSADAHLLTLSTTETKLCYTCGYARPADVSKPTKRGRGVRPEVQAPHPDARKATQECSGARYSVRLGHEYHSDVLQLRLQVQTAPPCPCHEADCRGALESAAAALVAGAAWVLGTSRDDLDAAVTGSHGGTATLMLFDTTPGGAGLARAAARQLPEVLRQAHRLASQCTCDSSTSCYACLRSYRNQWRHDHLVRSAAAAVLRPYVS